MKTCGFLLEGESAEAETGFKKKKKRFVTDVAVEVTLLTMCCASPSLSLSPPHQNGTVQCEAISCPPPQCPAGTAAAYVKGACCKECQREWSTLNLVTPPTLTR